MIIDQIHQMNIVRDTAAVHGAIIVTEHPKLVKLPMAPWEVRRQIVGKSLWLIENQNTLMGIGKIKVTKKYHFPIQILLHLYLYPSPICSNMILSVRRD